MATVHFRTNIDHCKRFMDKISGYNFDPAIGDKIVVYKEKDFGIELAVASRTWKRDERHGTPYLSCELGPTKFWEGVGLDKFYKMLEDRGFHE